MYSLTIKARYLVHTSSWRTSRKIYLFLSPIIHPIFFCTYIFSLICFVWLILTPSPHMVRVSMIDCSRGLLPRTMWKPVRPKMGMMSRAMMHMTTREITTVIWNIPFYVIKASEVNGIGNQQSLNGLNFFSFSIVLLLNSFPQQPFPLPPGEVHKIIKCIFKYSQTHR